MGFWAWRYSFKGSVAMAIFCWVYPHVADCVLIYQFKLLPPSIRTRVKWYPSIIGSNTKAAHPARRILAE